MGEASLQCWRGGAGRTNLPAKGEVSTRSDEGECLEKKRDKNRNWGSTHAQGVEGKSGVRQEWPEGEVRIDPDKHLSYQASRSAWRVEDGNEGTHAE